MVAASVARRQSVQGQQRHRRRVAVFVVVGYCCCCEPKRGDILDWWEGEIGVEQGLECHSSASKGGVVSRESQVDKLGE